MKLRTNLHKQLARVGVGLVTMAQAEAADIFWTNTSKHLVKAKGI